MPFEVWSYILTIVGLTGFYFVGKKKWWAWWINIGCQALWLIYAFTTHQYGFIAASVAYTIVFTDNLLKWRQQNKPKCKHYFAWTNSTYDGYHKRCLHCGMKEEKTDDDFGSPHG